MSCIEDKIKSLKAKINDNGCENIMYSDKLEVVRDATITSFSPSSINGQTSAAIACDVPPGLDALPGTLRSLGGTFTSENGQVFTEASVLITDPENYTSFSIEANNLPEGNYTITIQLGPYGRIGDIYRLTSTFELTVKPNITTKITSITPNIVSLSDLKNQKFTIRGTLLDQIQTGTGFFLRTPTYKFQFSGILTATSAQVSYINSILPETGNYRVLARNSTGSPIFSEANLTIRE